MMSSQVGADATVRGSTVREQLRDLDWRPLWRLGGLWLTIVIVMVGFQLGNPAFLGGANLLDLVRATSSLAIIALGETLVIMAGELDLSVGAIYGLASVLLAVLWINHDVPVYLALPIAVAAGAGVGLLNSFFTVAIGIPSFIVTLGMLSLLGGASILIGGSTFLSPAYVEPPLPAGELSFFDAIGGSSPLGIPIQVVWLIAISALFVLLIHRSLFGFRIRAIGGNEAAARVSRLPVARYRTLAFVLAGLLAALAGVIDFAFLGSTQASSSGSSLTFPVFAAVIIGGASLTGGSGTVVGTLTGALLLGVLSNGLSLNGIGGGAQQIFIGAVTIVAVGIDRWTVLGPQVRRWVRTRRRGGSAEALPPGSELAG